MAWGIAKGGRGVPKYKRNFVRKLRRKLERIIRKAWKEQALEEVDIDDRARNSAKSSWL